jgi:hypothetical protein
MRPYAMNDDQIECLASYVLSLSKREFPKSYTPKEKAEAIAGIHDAAGIARADADHP